MSYNEEDIEIICVDSSCSRVPSGSRVVLNGPMLNLKECDVVCMTALQAIYPYIISARFRVPPERFGFTDGRFVLQCPDRSCPAIFEIRRLKED
ncbi:MAG: TIGR04076 family protein [Dethiobacter sp.]|jgi:uncharacterized repeat protein (TIGR04076 family)|nr:MAG: TIGR04076 family protein [Dethiobacter sp.]